MATTKKDDATEELIKNTAKRLFFGEGKFNATTQEIADAAGVNRTLINYYFRSRDKLFDLVFSDAQAREQLSARATAGRTADDQRQRSRPDQVPRRKPFAGLPDSTRAT